MRELIYFEYKGFMLLRNIGYATVYKGFNPETEERTIPFVYSKDGWIECPTPDNACIIIGSFDDLINAFKNEVDKMSEG